MQSSIPHYPLFICGATAVALGIASQNTDKAFIVERTGLVAKEFIDCYNPGALEWKALSPLGVNLKKELKQRNILDEAGRVHIPAVASVLFKLIQDTGVNILLVTEIVEIKKTEELYEITLYNNSGFQKVTADKIIDTTSIEGTNKKKKEEYICSKSINAILHSKDEETFNFNHPDINSNEKVSYQQGRFTKEVILKYRLSLEDHWITARHKIHSYWQNRPSFLDKWQIASIASTFEVVLKEKVNCEIDDKWKWMPSSGYSNLLEAFEAGIVYGDELKGGLEE